MTDKAMSVLRTFELFNRTLLELVFLSVLVVAGVFAVPGCQKYDTLIEKDQVCQQRWSDLDADLQRRSELIPNLVATLKASAN
jgi:LemA protein